PPVEFAKRLRTALRPYTWLKNQAGLAMGAEAGRMNNKVTKEQRIGRSFKLQYSSLREAPNRKHRTSAAPNRGVNEMGASEAPGPERMNNKVTKEQRIGRSFKLQYSSLREAPNRKLHAHRTSARAKAGC